MYGQYSLTELANKIGVTSAWVNRVQRETGIGGQLGKKGHKVTFSEELVETFRRVKIFRFLGFSFSNIKRLYELEGTMLRLEELIVREYELPNITKHKISLMIHNKEAIAIGPYFLAELDEKTQELLYKDKNIEEYVTYVNELISTAKEIINRKDAFLNDARDVSEFIKRIAEEFRLE